MEPPSGRGDILRIELHPGRIPRILVVLICVYNHQPTDPPQRALKYSKARLGTHKRGKKKREEMQRVIQEMRKKH